MISLEEDGRALNEAERAALRGLIMECGVTQAARLADVSTTTYLRACCNVPITRESVAKLRAALQKEGFSCPSA